LGATTPVRAQPVTVPDTWGGDLWSRPRLTGSWGGLRDEMGKKGVVLDLDLLLMPQGVLSGGRDTDAGFWGGADYTLNVDTGKLGLWEEDAIELYYNAAITSWLGATLDIQVIEPALTKKLSSSGGSLEDVGTTVVAGLRFYVRF
jgi:carbohydrate-selective porin OprB